MDLQKAKQIFFKQNPHALAYFCFNKRLNKYVCYTYDYIGDSNAWISEKLRNEVREYAKGKKEDPIYSVMDYILRTNISQNLSDRLTDFYYASVVNGISFKDTDAVCDAFDKYLQKRKPSKNTSKQSLVGCYVVNEDGTLDDSRIFYMELVFTRTRDGLNVCRIENTFTEDDCRGKGLHTQSIRFLEAVLARKNVYTLIGESQECDAFESENDSTLEQHYEKLGFVVTRDKNGTNHIVKEIDPCFDLEISARDIDIQK